jgi:hypothetical protein
MKGCRVCDVDLCGVCVESGKGEEDERGGEGGGEGGGKGEAVMAVKVTSARRKYEEEGEEEEEGDETEEGVVIDRGNGEIHPYPSPLFLAAQFGHAEVCVALLRSGTRLNSITAYLKHINNTSKRPINSSK